MYVYTRKNFPQMAEDVETSGSAKTKETRYGDAVVKRFKELYWPT